MNNNYRNEYYYKNTAENNEMSNLKKQTRYTCKFVYIYDENKIGNNRNSFSISCPNCGAPLIGIGNYVCEYCSSQITPINLKTWKMSSMVVSPDIDGIEEVYQEEKIWD